MTPLIPAGQMAWRDTPTGLVSAERFPRHGVGVRANGEIIIAGGGEAFAAKLTAEDAAMLGLMLISWAEEQADAAVIAADAALERVVEAAGNA